MSLHGCFQKAIVDFLKDLPNGVTFKPGHLFMIQFIEKYIYNYDDSQGMFENASKLLNNSKIKTMITNYINDPTTIPLTVDQNIANFINDIFELEDVKKFSYFIFKDDITEIANTILKDMQKDKQVKKQIMDHIECAIQFVQTSQHQ
jgi:hypothetical protein